MIVLVDTSVWIRFLSNRSPHAVELDGLLSRDEVSGHGWRGRQQHARAYVENHCSFRNAARVFEEICLKAM